MKLNGWILAEDLKGVEGSSLKSDPAELCLTGALIWQEGILPRAYHVYVMYAGDLERIPKKHPALTLVSIGKPSKECLEREGMDILWVRPYLTPQMILSLLMKLFEKYRMFEEELDRLCRDGKPFSLPQADRLGFISLVALVFVIVELLFTAGLSYDLIPEYGYSMVINDGNSEPTINLNIGMLVFSAIMYSLSAIFRYAALLQQLSDETV